MEMIGDEITNLSEIEMFPLGPIQINESINHAQTNKYQNPFCFFSFFVKTNLLFYIIWDREGMR